LQGKGMKETGTTSKKRKKKGEKKRITRLLWDTPGKSGRKREKRKEKGRPGAGVSGVIRGGKRKKGGIASCKRPMPKRERGGKRQGAR